MVLGLAYSRPLYKEGPIYVQETRYLSITTYHLLLRFQLTDNFSDRAQSSKAMLKWSGTGSLPLIAGNEELLVPRRNSEVSQYIGDNIVLGITILKTFSCF